MNRHIIAKASENGYGHRMNVSNVVNSIGAIKYVVILSSQQSLAKLLLEWLMIFVEWQSGDILSHTWCTEEGLPEEASTHLGPDNMAPIWQTLISNFM